MSTGGGGGESGWQPGPLPSYTDAYCHPCVCMYICMSTTLVYNDVAVYSNTYDTHGAQYDVSHALVIELSERCSGPQCSCKLPHPPLIYPPGDIPSTTRGGSACNMVRVTNTPTGRRRQ